MDGQDGQDKARGRARRLSARSAAHRVDFPCKREVKGGVTVQSRIHVVAVQSGLRFHSLRGSVDEDSSFLAIVLYL
jgi:hypothetical protein